MDVEPEHDDDEALFGGRAESEAKRSSKKRCALTIVGVSLVILLLIGAVAIALMFLPAPDVVDNKRNVILLVSDGFGPASQTMARNYYTFFNNLTDTTMLPLDKLLIGSSRTRSTDSYVTDSASGATAFSCGIKTYNAAIAVNPAGQPCGTVLEAAKRQGYVTGTVATSRITHATPASFNAHVTDRDEESAIAYQQIGNTALNFRTTDIIMGGGRRYYVPASTPGSGRDDELDLMAMAKDTFGYRVIQNRSDFDSLSTDGTALPLLALFTMDHMSYEIDRQPTVEPSLLEMAQKTLALLDAAVARSDAPGYFVMIEGSRIDHAAHNGDPGAHLYEILMYNEMVEYVQSYVDAHPNTVVISVSDHECGGLTVGEGGDYLWNPDVLAKVRNSSDVVARDMLNAGATDVPAYVIASISTNMGVTDLSETELTTIVGYVNANNFGALSAYLGVVVSSRARLGWTTSGHTAVDVNLYGHTASSSVPEASLEKLRGNRENTEIGDFIRTYLSLDLQAITDILRGASQPGAGMRSTRDATDARIHAHKRREF